MIKRILRKGYEYLYNSRLKKAYYASQDVFCEIPQNLSFLIFGCHGVGLQSLLYFISKHTSDHQCVFPVPMDWTRQDAYTTALLNVHKKSFPHLFLGKWGLTFDGSPKNLYWINRNMHTKIPAIILVRDPLLTIISNLNLCIFRQIDQNPNGQNSDLLIDLYFKKILADSKLNEIIGYRSNLDYVDKYISKFMIVDTTEIIGECTNLTMSKIADFLELDLCDMDFNMCVNSAFTQSFPLSFSYRDAIANVSPFPEKYKPYGGYHYCEELKMNYINEAYFSSHFPNEKLYISIKHVKTQKNEKFNESIFYDQLNIALGKIKEKIVCFENIKIKKDDFLKYLQKYDNKMELRKKMEYEMYWILQQRGELAKYWTAYEEFLQF